jgi:ATP-dependent Lon protease
MSYTLEPGVRKLKEILFDLYGEINIEIMKCKDADNFITPLLLTPDLITNKYLKKYHKIEEKKIHNKSEIGIINGLWANVLGRGGIIPIQTMFYPCSTFLELRLTGLQGDVMKESMNVAKSLAWNITHLDKKKELTKSKAEILEYMKATRTFVNSFIDYLKEALRVDKENKHTIMDDVKKFRTEYDGSFSDFMEKEKKKSTLLMKMNM